MKRFRFRLQHVLRLREQTEEQAKLALGQATRRCDEIRLGIERAHAELAGLRIGSFDIMALQARDAYQRRLRQRIVQLENDLVAAEEARLAALEAYRKRRQEAEILRKLRERQWEEYRIEGRRQEDAALDDIVAAHHVPA